MFIVWTRHLARMFIVPPGDFLGEAEVGSTQIDEGQVNGPYDHVHTVRLNR